MRTPNGFQCDAVLEHLKASLLVPINKDILARQCGFFTRRGKADTRLVEECVHDLRHRGVPIVSGDHGYLWTEDIQAHNRWLAAMEHRAGEIEGTIRDGKATRDRLLRAHAVEPNGQARLFAEAAHGC